MAFSLFGKKPAPSPLASKAVVRPAVEQASLDFTQPGEMPSFSRPKIVVEEAAQQVPAAIEQAAMLYSIGQPEAAAAGLAEAVREQDLGRYEQRAWGMLFELYQMLGNQEDFERVAIEYAGRFETSPPTWRSDTGRESPVSRGGMATVSLNGVLNDKAAEAIRQLGRIVEKNPAVKLDLSRVTDADEQGCGLLNEALRQIKKARKECQLGGADKMAAILAGKITPGRQENEQAWLLLLELYRQSAAQLDFEEAAVNYAITFEVSPPSWEPVRVQPVVAMADGAAMREPAAGDMPGCVLEGDIMATNEDAFAPIRARAESAAEVVVDVSRLRRMDFVAAANLMNLVNALALSQKRVRLVRASHLLTALWELIGLDKVACIETRKA